MKQIFLTGFPGFLGSELLPRLLTREGDRAVCLVQPRYAEAARKRLEKLTTDRRLLPEQVQLVEGDITRPDLGLGDSQELRRSTDEVFHLAAVYDLEISREVGTAVNVEGTRNVLDFASGCERLRRLHYVSTCYVSGRHPGVFREQDLYVGQTFNNYYEETKYLAEELVQDRRDEGLPTTIYRPAVVVGDSRTGATQKYDGPYFFIRLLLRQPTIAFMPMVGDPTMITTNIVPSDFVVEAIAHLARLTESAGKVYQLADPHPLTVDRVLDEVARATRREVIRIPVPRKIAKKVLRHGPGVRSLIGIPPPAVDYFVHPTHYASENTQRDLEGTEIRVPPFPSYVDTLVQFVREHPKVDSTAMA